jgi:phage-related protein
MPLSRPISWLKAARREFETFPEEAQRTMLQALAIAAEGGNPISPSPSRVSIPACLKLR